MARNTKIQLRRGLSTDWLTNTVLAPGEIGFELDTGKFKIGATGLGLTTGSNWGDLPYAGGSALISNTGIGFKFNSSNNAYTLYSYITGITGGQDGITFQTLPLSGLLNDTTVSGTYYTIGLSTKLENFHDLSSNGIVVQTGNNGFAARSVSGLNNNISITNGNGVSGNPIIGLNPSITGITSITGVNNFRIASSSGITIDAGSGVVTVDDLKVDGYLTIGAGIDILLAARILATGPIVYSGNPTIYSGEVYYSQTPYVGPTGGGAVPVSLSGHSHTYSDITNFCSGVASCVDTALTVSTGLRADFSSNTLQLALSGQAATLHSFTGTGLMVRTSGPDNNGVFSARSIAQGTNISVANGDGVSANPTISLNASITGLTDVKSSNIYATAIYANEGQNTLNIYAPSVNVTGNLTVANLTVTGVTTTVNSTTITVQDPVLTLGGTGVISGADNLDRGLQLRYWNGSAAATGFMGWNNQSSEFIFLSSTTGTITYNDYGAGTFGRVKVGSLVSNGSVSGTDLYATNQTAHRVAVFDANSMLFSTGVRTSELTHLTGVTSSIQDQLNSKVSNTRTLTPGSGLDGSTALDLSSDRTFNVGQGDGISVLTDTVNVNNTVLRTSGTQTISGVKTFTVAPIFSGGLTSSGTINLQVAATASTGSHFPVFVSDPTAGSQQLVSRTLAQMRTDLGTSLNTGNTLVLRDTNGNFGAGNITGTLIGNASAATNATSASGIYISGITSSDPLVSIVLVADQSASSQLPFIDSGLQYNASEDILILKSISGTLNIPFNGYTSPSYSSTSISGIIPMNGPVSGTYLYNFIIDGGTP
jgi:hypothetical protein